MVGFVGWVSWTWGFGSATRRKNQCSLRKWQSFSHLVSIQYPTTCVESVCECGFQSLVFGVATNLWERKQWFDFLCFVWHPCERETCLFQYYLDSQLHIFCSGEIFNLVIIWSGGAIIASSHLFSITATLRENLQLTDDSADPPSLSETRSSSPLSGVSSSPSVSYGVK